MADQNSNILASINFSPDSRDVNSAKYLSRALSTPQKPGIIKLADPRRDEFIDLKCPRTTTTSLDFNHAL
jgi:hypothetical protein